MARNRKPEYIKKLINTQAPNGYKFDVANYLYNPSCDNDYPSFTKVLSEDEETQTVRRVYYFKYRDGSGEYKEAVYNIPKAEGWAVVKNRTEKVLESSDRFNLKKLLSFCA